MRTRKVVWFAATLLVIFAFGPLFLIWAQFVAGWALDPLFQYWPVFYAVAGLAGAGVLVFEWATNRRRSVLVASISVVVFAFGPLFLVWPQFAAGRALDPLFQYLPMFYAVGGLVAAGVFVFEWTTSRTSRNIALPGAIFGLLMFLEGLLTVVQDGHRSWVTQVLTAAMLIPMAFMVRGAVGESEEEG